MEEVVPPREFPMKQKPSPRVCLLPSRTVALGLFIGLTIALSAGAAETIILKDGFVLQGNIHKEVTSINDPATGKTFPIAKDAGLDMIDEGPKVTIFSTHAKQLGEVGKDIKLRPEYRAFKLGNNLRKSHFPFPPVMTPRDREAAEFNDKWRRTITVNVPGGFDKIEQQITYLDPYFCYLWSPTHIWRLAYRTSELDPKMVRKLLSTHPELVEEPGKPDPEKRIAIARFMLDTGWLKYAKDDLDMIRKTFTGGLPKNVQEALDKLAKDIDVATAGLVIKEAELALNSGRYRYASDLLDVFPDKTAEPKQTDDATKLMAELKTSRERYDTGRRVLRSLLDNLTGKSKANPLLAASGGTAIVIFPAKELPGPLAKLAAAAEDLYAELHPDSAHRIEFFVNLAMQVEREVKQGRDPSKRPEELLATAISGWVKGKNGATTEPEAALRLWNARETVLQFQRADTLNAQAAVLATYKRGKPIKIDELAQVISLLPPAQPENLLFRTGTEVIAKDGTPTGIFKRKTGSTSIEAGGISYYVKLPPEYHHGRAYPVLMAMTDAKTDPKNLLALIGLEADKHGYILIAPEWGGGQFGGVSEWKYNGSDHEYVTAVLRDAVSHFCVDNDRVFMLGLADGANMAMDIGASHPDLFAGVVAMGPSPKWGGLFDYYWQNAQKLPFYVVTGEMTGLAMQNLRRIFGPWMRYGFASLMVVYKGRGTEWYSAETPIMFDWMNRKKRANGTATLRLDNGTTRTPWFTMRSTDNRFYWLGVDKIADPNLIENSKNGKVTPAEISGDIGGNNVINIHSRGVTRLSLWLGQEMIDWTKPVAVNINSGAARGWRPKVLEPDIDVLLKDYRDRGDRRMLYLQRLEFETPP
jgi:pimeloyl-ACP methyl ester carboxylesterase